MALTLKQRINLFKEEDPANAVTLLEQMKDAIVLKAASVIQFTTTIQNIRDTVPGSVVLPSNFDKALMNVCVDLTNKSSSAMNIVLQKMLQDNVFNTKGLNVSEDELKNVAHWAIWPAAVAKSSNLV